MGDELEIFKKKLLYRASYRGTKEMDILLCGFVKEYINVFDMEQLLELEKFLKFDDETIMNFYNFNVANNKIEENTISLIFKKYRI